MQRMYSFGLGYYNSTVLYDLNKTKSVWTIGENKWTQYAAHAA